MPVELWHCSNSEYHAEQEHESSTTLKLLHEDPMTYYAARIAKTIPMPSPSPGPVNLGSAFEIKLFEPHHFERLVAVTDDGYKSAGFRKFAASLKPDQVAITSDDNVKIPKMVDAVYADPKCRALMEANGQTQVSLRGEIGKPSIKVKARFDKLLDDGRSVQLKTTARIVTDDFSKQSGDLNYHVAEVLYRIVRDEARECGAVKLGDNKDCEMIVVSTDEPFEAFNYFIGPDSMKLGRSTLQEIIRDLLHYRTFPPGEPWRRSQHGERTPIEVPRWMFPRVE